MRKSRLLAAVRYVNTDTFARRVPTYLCDIVKFSVVHKLSVFRSPSQAKNQYTGFGMTTTSPPSLVSSAVRSTLLEAQASIERQPAFTCRSTAMVPTGKDRQRRRRLVRLTESVDVLREISEEFPSSLQRFYKAVSQGRDVVSGVEHLASPAQNTKKKTRMHMLCKLGFDTVGA